MRKILFIISLCFLGMAAEAKHISGGEMTYEYVREGTASNTKVYRITLRLFRDENCSGCADMPANVSIGVFNNTNNTQVGSYYRVALQRTETVPLAQLPGCIVNPPNIVYRVGFYVFEVILDNNVAGYTAAYQTCCRIDNIANIPNSSGATYSTVIPGVRAVGEDNSPQFAISVSVMCFNKPFTLDFSATDADGDSLVYAFCGGLNGGAATDASYATPSPPPYPNLSYINGFTGGSPLGNRATINSSTGIISGIAPNNGRYVVSVCVFSFRNGVLIAQHRKDLIVTVDACDFAGVQLDPTYITCDGFTLSFENQNNSPLNQTFFWDFGNPASPNNTSTLPTPTHTYTDTGVFILKLVVNRGQSCSDSTTAIVRVYPGFIPRFIAPTPNCVGSVIQFRDQTFARYGFVNSWKWDFGVNGSLADTSIVQNPIFTYPAAGTYQVSLKVGSSKGCSGDTTLEMVIVDKAPLNLTNDTLICSIDTLQLNAASPNGGTITWSPNYNISSTNSFNPLVSPDISTTYFVSFTDNFGCRADDSVVVKVVDFVTLNIIPDTTICRTDPVILPLRTDALYYTWTPPATLDNPSIKNPTALTLTDETYSVVGTIGKCSASGTIRVKVIPYPIATASNDTAVCFRTSANLQASGGSIYQWSPSAFLNNPNIPNPVAQNVTTDIRYILSVRDTFGCPKPVFDTVFVSMIRIIADAGPRDTSIVRGQPLQLNAEGGVPNAIYTWSPSTWLENPNIDSPIALPEDSIRYFLEIKSVEGCIGRDTIRVRVFNTAPDIFVPTAFTPNGDTKNDEFKPIPVGMRTIDKFIVYNRWGQLVYASTNQERGWNGSFKGKLQEAGTYVWYAEGIDYTGKKISKKGTVILIR